MMSSMDEKRTETNTTNTSSDCSLETTEHQLLTVFEPFVYSLDASIECCVRSQTELNQQLDALLVALNAIKSNPDLSSVIEEKTKKLLTLKRRLTLIHTIVQNSNDRIRKLIINYRLNESQSKPIETN